nr:Type 1 glutamine amidotransferase-like domain-containing protein [uncultured Niameybacter sp.]
MHLILTSCDFGNEKSKKCIIKNLKKPIEQCKVLFFPNEKATQEMIQSEKYYQWMQECGFEKENVYIFDYYNPKKFINLQIDCLHISGGSACQTLDRIRSCNADKIITNYINQGVTYIGGSAGTHIATKNIMHVLPFEQSISPLFDLLLI